MDEDSKLSQKKLLNHSLFGYYAFIVLSLVIISVTIETTIPRIAGFSNSWISRDSLTTFEFLLVIDIIVNVLLVLGIKRVLRTLNTGVRLQRSLYIICASVQGVILTLILMITIEANVSNGYHIALLTIIILLSYVFSIIIISLLLKRFLLWHRSSRFRVIAAYIFFAISILANDLLALAYTLDEISDGPLFIKEMPFPPFLTHSEKNELINNMFVGSSIFLFSAAWFATVLFLKNYSSRIGAVKYWLIVSIPLLYFMSQYQGIFLDIFHEFRENDPIGFATLKTIIVTISRPVGGLLFGIAFVNVAGKINNTVLRNYLFICAIGVVLIFTSNQAELLVSSGYPPFGIIAISFVGVSSYMIYLGIFASATTISLDLDIRRAARKSVESDVKFLSSIGTAEMEEKVNVKALDLAKSFASNIRSEIEPSMTIDDIKKYMKEVTKEISSNMET